MNMGLSKLNTIHDVEAETLTGLKRCEDALSNLESIRAIANAKVALHELALGFRALGDAPLGRSSAKHSKLLNQQYYKTARLILINVFSNHHNLFSASEKSLWLQTLFRSPPAPPHVVFPLLSQFLKTEDPASQLFESCLLGLNEFVHSSGPESLFRASKHDSPDKPRVEVFSDNEFCELLCGLPGLLSNRMRGNAPEWAYEPRYYQILAESLLKALTKAPNEEPLSPANSRSNNTLHVLVMRKMIRLGLSELLVKCWVALRQGSNDLEEACVMQALDELTFEKLFLASLSMNLEPLQVSNNLIAALFVFGVSNFSSFRQFAISRLLLHKTVTKSHLPLLLHCYQIEIEESKAAKTSTPLFSETFRELARVWASKDFVNRSGLQHASVVSEFINFGVKLIPKDELMRDEAFQHLLEGIQIYLGQAPVKIRSIGISVAKALSETLDPENPVIFEDEAAKEESESVANDTAIKQNTRAAVNPSQPSKGERDGQLSKQTGFLSCDTVVDFDSMIHSQNITIAQSGDKHKPILFNAQVEFEPYDITEVANIALRPSDLDKAQNALQSDDVNAFEASLNLLESMIRRNPENLDDFVPSLTARVLNLENKFSTPDFVKKRKGILVALCVASPMKCIPTLHTSFSSERQFLQIRLDVLEVISRAAAELSGHKKLTVASSTKLMKKNIFTPYAGIFFFPLMESYGNPTAKNDPFGFEHIVLCALLETLALIFECTAPGPIVVQMAKSLLMTSFLLLNHEKADVRSQSLRNILIVYRKDKYVLEMYLSERPQHGIKGLLERIHRWDPDLASRELAELVMYTYKFS